jgi:predicted Zn-dependent protease
MKAEERAKIESEFNRAIEIWRDGDGQMAVQILERLASEHPNRPFILGMLGAIYRSLGDYERAVGYFQQTASLSPKSELASLGLFHSLWQLERREAAMDEMTRFLSVASSEEYDLLINESLGE